MKTKVVLSIAASMLLVGTQANALSLGNAKVDSVNLGSILGCSSDFDFYYKTFGGFVKGTGIVSAVKFTRGQDDTYDDGFWWREGPFSSSVYYGDIENGNKRYSQDPNGAYPAWTWGHPERDPFVSLGDAGDNLGGAGGIGMGGFGIGDGNKIKVGDTDTFYPLSFLEVNNFINSAGGTYAADVSWNVVLYDKKHNEVFKKNYTTTAYYWETPNFRKESVGLVCARNAADKGEVVNDLAFNKAVHENIYKQWPVAGLNVDFISDGVEDTVACSDPVTFKDTTMTDTFVVKSSLIGKIPVMGKLAEKKYEISFDGPYVYDDTKEGCPTVTKQGLPYTLEKWPAKCFTKVGTIWSTEDGKARAFMRMSIKKAKTDLCGIKAPELKLPKLPKPDLKLPKLPKPDLKLPKLPNLGLKNTDNGNNKILEDIDFQDLAG